MSADGYGFHASMDPRLHSCCGARKSEPHEPECKESLEEYFMMKRNRPYNGQPHTGHGIRGATEIKGITFRDLRDAYVRAWFLASGHVNPELCEEAQKGEDANLREEQLYGWDLNKVDPVAVVQNLSCEIERLMGIYPNVPKLEPTP